VWVQRVGFEAATETMDLARSTSIKPRFYQCRIVAGIGREVNHTDVRVSGRAAFNCAPLVERDEVRLAAQW
jgi:hypothetical protein